MTDKSKIDQAFNKYKVIEIIFNKKTELEPRFFSQEEENKHQETYTAGYKQARIDLAENIHVALTFAECGLKDKDYALKLAREIIDKELDDDYWKNR